MSFDADIRHWQTLGDFAADLAKLPRPGWVTHICNHNTYRPNERQWKGVASVQSCMQTYIGKGWSAGPHLFLAGDAPKVGDTGIFQLTPLGHIGVHAGPCNSHAIGIEWVGDFDARPCSAQQYALGLAVNVVLCRAWGLDAGAITIHKLCMPGRTCPGRYFPFDQLREDVADRLAAASGQGVYRVAGLPVYYDSLLTRPTGAHLAPGQVVLIDATAADNPTRYARNAVHVSDTQGGGFVDGNGLEKA